MNGRINLYRRVLCRVVRNQVGRLCDFKDRKLRDEENELQNRNNQINQDEVEQDGYDGVFWK